MPSGFFVLLRFYLRVDDVLIRINDTRLYYEKDNQYILREYTSKESKAKDLKVWHYKIDFNVQKCLNISIRQVPRVFWGDPNEISQHLSLSHSLYEKLEF